MAWSHIVSYYAKLLLPLNEIFSVYRCQYVTFKETNTHPINSGS